MNAMTSYPDWVFPPLRNLTHLYIDLIVSPEFKSGFGHLKGLRYLQMGDCNPYKLVNKTFEVFRNISIKTLHMKCPNLLAAENGVFQPFLALTTLTFSHNSLGVNKNLEMLNAFEGRRMKRLDMGWVFPRTLFSPENAHTLLTKQTTKYLREICVEEFIFDGNHIIYLEYMAFMNSLFSACIQHLDLSDNNFKGDIRVLLELSLFPVLRYINLHRVDIPFNWDPPSMSHNYQFVKTLQLVFPVSLQYADFSRVAGSSLNDNVEVIVVNATRLKTFIFCNNYDYFKNARFIRGLENVHVLDISDSNLGLVDSPIFKSFPNVRKLYVRSCKMSLEKKSHLLFDHMFHLEYIDLSDNALSVLPNLPNPTNIKELNLSINAFDDVSVLIDSFTNMTTLDLSFNRITHLNFRKRNQLDEAYSMRNLQLRLNGNIFSCGCDNLEFILWLVESQVVFETNRNFSCVQEAGISMGTLDVARNYLKISRHCNGRYLLSYVITCLTILLGSISTVYVVARNPARYKQLLHKVFGFGHLELRTTDFHYQLYVAYCELNIPFVFRKLRPALELGNEPVRLFLKDRDVLPGVDVADGIVVGVNGSFRSLLVVSREFLEDRWCQFSINVVVNSMNPLVPNRTILLLLDDVQLADLPEPLLNAVDEDFILKVGNYENREASLWRRVRELACI